MAERTPALAYPPGDFLKEELEARGWTQSTLAEVMGRPVQFISEVVSGKKIVTPETACGLAEAFGTSAEFWLNMEVAYRLWLVRFSEANAGKPRGEVAKRAKLYELAPVKDMVRRGWIPATDSAADLEASLNDFYGRKVLGPEAVGFPMAARKSTDYSVPANPAQSAWARRAAQLAHSVKATEFDLNAFRKGLIGFHNLVTHEQSAQKTPAALADLGVRLVIVEHLPQSEIDGAAFWLGEKQPVIALSMRHDRLDNFWFTLAHELAHILHGDRGSYDDNLVGKGCVSTDTKPDIEKRADVWAADYLLTTSELERFILRTRPYYSKSRINQFANRVKVHPAIIVGQLQRRGEIAYSHSREALVKVKELIVPSATSDGWGLAPVTR
jgi:HTH-type transcriptional regulator/antitoxin HigA